MADNGHLERLQRRAADTIAHDTLYTCPSCDDAPVLTATHSRDNRPLHLECAECGYQEPYRR